MAEALRVLLVDDSATERYVIGEALKGAGFTVFTAEDGETSVPMAKKMKPDVIVMDVVMPGMNGFQACRLITQDAETANIPVILCTSKGQATDKMWGERQGAKGYVVKPVDGAELIAQIKGLTANAG